MRAPPIGQRKSKERIILFSSAIVASGPWPGQIKSAVRFFQSAGRCARRPNSAPVRSHARKPIQSHTTEHARRQLTLNDRRKPDGNLRGELVVNRMEVRGQMFVPIHPNRDAEETAVSGMDGLWFLIQQHFRFLAGHLKPERIGTKIKLIVPEQFAAVTNAGLAKILAAVPRGINACARF